MMTSKPEDRLRKNGVKTRKYYKWLRWSMKEMFITEIYKAFFKNKNFFIVAIKDDEQNSLFDTIIERNQIVFSYLYKDIIQDQIKLDYLSYKYASTQVMLLKKWLNNGMVESPEFMTEVYLDSHKNYENMHESIINKKTNWLS